MGRFLRTVYLVPAGIVLLAATIAMVVLLVGTATAAAVPAGIPLIDTGSQGFHGERDLGVDAGVGKTLTTSEPKITEALQPGQTVSAVAPGNGSGGVGAPAPFVAKPSRQRFDGWTPDSGPASAPQPGQTGW